MRKIEIVLSGGHFSINLVRRGVPASNLFASDTVATLTDPIMLREIIMPPLRENGCSRFLIGEVIEILRNGEDAHLTFELL